MNIAPTQKIRPATAYLPPLAKIRQGPGETRHGADHWTRTATASIVNAACERDRHRALAVRRKVANDPRPVAALEGGRELGEESAERVLNFIAALDAAKAVTHA